MNRDLTKKLERGYLYFQVISVFFVILLINFDTCGSTIKVILISYADDLAWNSTMVLFLFFYMHHSFFKKMENREQDLLSYAVNIIFFGLLSALNCFAGYFSYDPVYFPIGVIPIILAGLFGGLRVSLPATAIAASAYCFTTSLNMPLEIYLCLLIVAGISSGIVSSLRPYRHVSMIPFLMVFLAYALLLPDVISHDQNELYYEVSDFYLASLISIPIEGAYCLALIDMFKSLLKDEKTVEKNEEDLRLAHDIQLAAVPKEFPNTRSIEIYADMEPAIEVGGDFYDCFRLGRNLTVFVIADVSDKGLPSSLLMMRMMGSVKTSAIIKPEPGAIMTAINKELCRNNPANQFITMWIGIYDSDTGILQYANAGHTPPYIVRKDGGYQKLPLMKGLVIGFNENIRYKNTTLVLDDGDLIFAYTDGINEAFDSEGRQFGHVGIQSVLGRMTDRSPRSLIDSMKCSVKEFSKGVPTSDDITMLSFSVNRSNYHRMTVDGKVGELDKVNGFIGEVMERYGFPVNSILKMNIVSEEIFVNICDHAYKDSEGRVDVYCRCLDGEVKITFADEAGFFNPINKEDIYIDENIGNWPIGGFGIHMIKNLVDHMDYKYFSGKNIFTVWKKIDVGQKAD